MRKLFSWPHGRVLAKDIDILKIFLKNSLRHTNICKTSALECACILHAAAAPSGNYATIVQCQNWKNGVDTILFNSVTDLPGDFTSILVYARAHVHVHVCVVP